MDAYEELKQMPGHLARRFHQQSVALFQQGMGSAGIDLTPVQYAALVAIATHPGIDQATLAGLIAHDRTTIGGVVDRLEHKGLLNRTVSETDRRARVLVVTPDGNRLLQAASAAVAATQAQLVAGMSVAEAAELVRLLQKALAASAAPEV